MPPRLIIFATSWARRSYAQHQKSNLFNLAMTRGRVATTREIFSATIVAPDYSKMIFKSGLGVRAGSVTA
jgi:hypothetical protein